MNLEGTWDVVASPDFDEEYLHMEVSPYVTLRRDGERIVGEYQVGLQAGSLDGRPEEDGRVLFTFEGQDEMDPVDGAATAILQGDRLIFKLMYHLGDDFTFECERRRG
jgi:hypothetical protein